jgi:hypothetical protein
MLHGHFVSINIILTTLHFNRHTISVRTYNFWLAILSDKPNLDEHENSSILTELRKASNFPH